MLRKVTSFFKGFTRSHRQIGTPWESTVCAASEEWVDETVFSFTPVLPPDCSLEALVAQIVRIARGTPDQASFIEALSEEFRLPEGQALTSIDRALGGIVRAASGNTAARPDRAIDPVASAAFDRAVADLGILDDIYPDWRDWEPGFHSPSP